MELAAYLPSKNMTIFICGLAVAAKTVSFIYKKYTEPGIIMDTMFFSDDSSKCRNHSNNPCELPDCPIRNIKKVLTYIESAKESLDVCMNFWTYHPLAKAAVHLNERNVQVRVITDSESNKNIHCQINFLEKEGIPVRRIDISDNMHHKFAIIDKKLVLTGSANWTSQAFFNNYENILVINKPDVLKSYSKEFERLWALD
ncbi:mitochondrial cardiolipin hydrolase-like [Copidosoma floridanum]|uniref:mitochondrial cardiolipin hydrolase-like n=1 Tax=Copidosoma floridanum TaxID=29053 RepID=UPI0006C962A7|nr:mitochondrial cardiolipin hydrolase-like [Copidosoma floridanum]